FLSARAGALTVWARAREGRKLTIAFLFLFAAIGAVALWRRDKRAATIVLGVTLLPIVCALISLAVINHWFAVRYVAPALIGFVVLAAVGMTSIRLQWVGGVAGTI